MPRNPPWTRDELILALDLYFRLNPNHCSKNHPEIQRLSTLLNELPVHAERPDGESFRNPNGVYMKMCNFLRFDPNYNGVGLTRGGRQEETIWNEFSGDLKKLTATANAILESRDTISPVEVEAAIAYDGEEFQEGRLLTAVHKVRERNASAVRRKKAKVLAETGALACEVCGFDFEREYGALGAGYAECHHTVPLSALSKSRTTRLADLAILCANCHRMIHRSKPMLSVGQLTASVKQHNVID